ncbi:hypothetical protein IWQ62_002537 [Dispira parvispora]|uniref:RRM domain-containing protein n=1 Tax=Dispira parvispora TaxID=1520584 RepID=A0A9W8E2K4_9FUNG|nr:hypothetical protein IWQ62_002537 [Dispira parvispora]
MLPADLVRMITIGKENISGQVVHFETRADRARVPGASTLIVPIVAAMTVLLMIQYDLRAATRALESLNGREINGIPIDVRYSLPKNDEAFKEFCDRHKNQGTLLVTARDCPLPLNDSDLRSYFQQFGDVASFKPFRSNERQRLVEYYDSRDCIRANDMAHGTEYNGGTLHCRFIWDLNQKLMTRQSVDAERAKSVRGRGVRGSERSSSFRGHHEGEGDYGRGHYRRSSPPPRRQRYSPGQSRERYLAGQSSRETSVTRPRDDPHRAPPPAQATLDAQRLQQAQQAQQLISNMMSGQASNLNQTQQPAINPAAALQMAANSPQGFQLAQLMNLFGQIQTNPQMLNIQSLVNPAILQALVGGAAAGAAGHTPASLAAGEKAVTTPAGIPNVPALAPTPAPVSIPTSITSSAPVSAATTNVSQLLGNGLGLSVKQPMETTLPTPGVSRERPESSVTTPTTAMATTISSGMVGQPPESVGASVPLTNLLSPPHVTATPTTSIGENMSKSTWAPVTTTAETSLSPQTSTTPAAVVSTPSTTQPGTTATTVSHASLYYNPITSQGSSDMYGAPGTEADSRMDEYTYY